MNRRIAPLLLLLAGSSAVSAPAFAFTDLFASGHIRGDRGGRAGQRVSVVVGEAAPGTVASVTADVSSDGGRETLTLTEFDAWLHGAATLPALPAGNAELALTLYDGASASLMSFSGTLAADGSVTLKADPSTDTSGCTSRLGCTVTEARDIELLAADVFAASSGYDVAIDLAGADAYDVAYAALRVTPCDLNADTGICLYNGQKVTTAEVGWDTIGTVWEADLALEHDGPVDLKVKVRAEDGPTESLKSSLGLPWIDGGDGVATLAADADPLTTLGLLYGREGARVQTVRSAQLAVVSEGWTLDTAPTHAEVELTNGETITIPANSYQRRKRPDMLTAEWDELLDESLSSLSDNPLFRLVIDGSTMTIDGGSVTLADLSSPLCAEGTCVTLVEDETGSYGLSVTQYRWDTAFVAGEVDVSLALLDADGAELIAAESVVTFDDADVTVVFANDVSFSGDPLHAALSGRVNLLGAADGHGTQDTLASGRFFSTVTRDGEGDLGLSGVGVDDVASMPATSFAVLLGGERSSCGDDDGGFLAPPPLAAVFGNGSGTKNATTTTSTRPELL
ncbi:MAG: hypothetical protein Q8P41_28945 [Pseudomonadota bacterium]|nr:hypothetical protein [Pseudomonadota bacterium]